MYSITDMCMEMETFISTELIPNAPAGPILGALEKVQRQTYNIANVYSAHTHFQEADILVQDIYNFRPFFNAVKAYAQVLMATHPKNYDALKKFITQLDLATSALNITDRADTSLDGKPIFSHNTIDSELPPGFSKALLSHAELLLVDKNIVLTIPSIAAQINQTER